MVKNKVSENRFDSILDLGQRNCSLYVEIGLYLWGTNIIECSLVLKQIYGRKLPTNL